MNILLENTIESKKTTEELASIVKRLGNPVSHLLLNSSCHTFSLPEIDGLIGYYLVRNCAVVVGDPVCLPNNLPALTKAFHAHCQKYNWSIVYFLASDSFAHWAINNGCHTLIQVGEELILDPTCYKKKQKLRWKINQSLLHGVVVKQYRNSDTALENQMKNSLNTWLKSKRGPQIYLGSIDLFAKYADNRIFYASQEEKIVGFLVLSRIDQFQGWVVTSFFATPDAPVGVTEHLMSSAFDVLSDENCHFLCIGAASGTKLGEIVGLNIFTKFFVNFIFNVSSWFFQFHTRKKYFKKFHPSSQPTFLLFSGKLGIKELLALKKILNVKF